MEPLTSSEEQTPQFTAELEGLLEEIAAPSASTGLRFANFVIDYIALWVVSFVIGIIIALLGLSSAYRSASFVDSNGFHFMSLLAYTLVYIVYYTILEGTTGRTIGKFCTSTKVVRETGGAISMKDALLRSLCRLVPFEIFSCFGYPWHDSWTHTTVVSSRNN